MVDINELNRELLMCLSVEMMNYNKKEYYENRCRIVANTFRNHGYFKTGMDIVKDKVIFNYTASILLTRCVQIDFYSSNEDNILPVNDIVIEYTFKRGWNEKLDIHRVIDIIVKEES